MKCTRCCPGTGQPAHPPRSPAKRLSRRISSGANRQLKSSPVAAAALTPVQVAALVDATLAKKESIGTLSHKLRELGTRPLVGELGRTQLHLFEDRLGAAGFWRLVEHVGNLNHLSFLLEALTPTFREAVLAPPQAPQGDGWIALATRGSLYDLARFAADSLGLLPAETGERFRCAVQARAMELAGTSTWGSLGSALSKAEDIADDLISKAVRDASGRRIDSVDINELVGAAYEEAADALWVLWQNRVVLRPDLGTAFWQLLPNELTWPRNYRLLLKAGFLLIVSRSPQVCELDAHRLLRAFAPLALDTVLDPKSARYHALFLWNIFALWFERGKVVSGTFRDLQHPQTWNRFVGIVERRLRWRRNDDKLDTLMLAGVLAYLVPALRARLVELVRGKIIGIKYLAELVDKDPDFITAFFIFHGMALTASEQAVFTTDRVGLLLEKAKAYDDHGPALDHILGSLHSFAATLLSKNWGAKFLPAALPGERRH